MSMKYGNTDDAAALRRLAEARLNERVSQAEVRGRETWDEADFRRLKHELEVHQIELEMQNEALQQALVESEAVMIRCIDLFDFAPVGYFNLSPEGAILAVNLAGARIAGMDRADLCLRRFTTLVSPRDVETARRVFAAAREGGEKTSCEIQMLQRGEQRVYVQIEAVVSPDGKEVRATVQDISARRAAETERARSIAELEYALAHVKLLSGLIPMCTTCKRVRDADGDWSEVEEYISTKTEARVTHGLCPDCFAAAVEDAEGYQ